VTEVGSLRVVSDVIQGMGAGVNLAGVSLTSPSQLSNVSVKAAVNLNTGTSVGLLARYGGSGDSNCYRGELILVNGQPTLSIYRNLNGTPLLLEAVSEDEATARGPVAAVPIEESLAWREADRVDVFRLATGLASEDRTRIVAWARRTAARGLPFRDAEFGDIYRAWLLWDPKNDRPRDAAEFERLIGELRARLQASDAYDCATLVWHAYLDNTAAHIDLASPNRVKWGGAIERESKRLAAVLQPVIVLPDSLSLSGKLRRVAGE